MNKILIFLLPALILACKKEVPEALKNLAKFEDQYDKSKDPKDLQTLLSEYVNFVTTPGGDKKLKIQVLEKAEQMSTANNRFFESAMFLNTLIKEDVESPKAADRILQLADLMKNVIRNEQAANTLYAGFIEKFPNHPKVSDVQKNIGSQPTNVKTMIQTLAATMYDDSLHQFNESVATQYVDATEAYVLINPTDPDCADLLNKAAETARQLKTYNKSISLYDWVIEKYPTSKFAAQSLFMKAFTFDNELKDIDNARTFYQEFIKNFPNHDFADDAKVLIENLGKTDQEFLQSIQNK